MSDELRYYNVVAEVRDNETFGTARYGVIATTRDEAVSRTRKHMRVTSDHGRRVTRIVSARLSQRFLKKGAHA